jgi:hypothetical protein
MPHSFDPHHLDRDSSSKADICGQLTRATVANLRPNLECIAVVMQDLAASAQAWREGEITDVGFVAALSRALDRLGSMARAEPERFLIRGLITEIAAPENALKQRLFADPKAAARNPAFDHPLNGLVVSTFGELLERLEIDRSAPVALHTSAGDDTRSLVFLSPTALELRAGRGASTLGIRLPAAPLLHVRANSVRPPSGWMRFEHRGTRITPISGPHPVNIAGTSARLTQVRVESDCPAWHVHEPWILEISGREERLVPLLAALGLQPSITIGVGHGAGAVPAPWVVTDRLPGAKGEFVAGQHYAIDDHDPSTDLVAVSRLSRKWGNDTWLFTAGATAPESDGTDGTTTDHEEATS